VTSKLDKVREIILKQFFQNSEKRMADLEAHLNLGFSDMNRQIKDLKEYVDSEMLDVKGRIDQDKKERVELSQKVTVLTAELSKIETRISKEIAILNREVSQFNMKGDAGLTILKRAIAADISKVVSKIAVDHRKLEDRLTGLFKQELALMNQTSTREIQQKQKDALDKIATAMRKLERDFDTLQQSQGK